MKMHVDIAKIKPAGAIAIVAVSAVAIVMSFTAKLGVPDRYTPRHDPAYYSQNNSTMTELLDEFQTFVLPRLGGVTSVRLSENGTRISVEADPDECEKINAVLIRDFGPGLFEVYPGLN